LKVLVEMPGLFFIFEHAQTKTARNIQYARD
jgi:hypothetical protein